MGCSSSTSAQNVTYFQFLTVLAWVGVLTLYYSLLEVGRKTRPSLRKETRKELTLTRKQAKQLSLMNLERNLKLYLILP